jgi:hypothetical protein
LMVTESKDLTGDFLDADRAIHFKLQGIVGKSRL